jgi:hypothetical protein
MRIRELLEGKRFNDLDFVNQGEDGTGINYDLIEDLTFFMQNDDDVYRRYLYPKVADCVENLKAKHAIKPAMFKTAVESSYKQYIKNYPIRHLPDSLEEEICTEICKKLHDDLCKDYNDGKYKG